jgi:hypothetical protein
MLADYRAFRTKVVHAQPSDPRPGGQLAPLYGNQRSMLRLIERTASARDAAPAWPFRLRVSLLGGFELVRDGQPVTFTEGPAAAARSAEALVAPGG